MRASLSLASASNLLRGICSGVLDLVYPPYCLVCGLAGEEYLCQRCVDKVTLLEPPQCGVCGVACESSRCSACRDRAFAFDAARSAAAFEGTLRTAIHEFKYRGHRMLAEPLGELMARRFVTAPFAARVDAAIAVPIHRRRRAERGFNQAEELARVFCGRLRMELLPGVLVKSRETRHQVDLPHEERPANVAGAFRVPSGAAVAGRRLLLIDDVFTTGSTLDEAARALRAAGASRIFAYTLARGVLLT